MIKLLSIAKYLLPLFVLIGLNDLSCKNPDEPPTNGEPGYSEMISKSFYSSFINDTVKLDISLPLNYPKDKGKKYKAV
ncbi:MAG: hypothetical protein ACM34M_13985, partial [Ignavibacteria bacterium]